MSKATDNYEALAVAVGLRYDRTNNVIYGQRDGFDLMIYAEDSRYPYLLTIHTAAKRFDAMGLSKEEKKEFVKSLKNIMSLRQEGNQIIATQRAVNKQEKLRAALGEEIGSLIAFLRAKGYAPCCSICGQNVPVSGFRAGGAYTHLCPDCESRTRGIMMDSNQEVQQKKENLVGGIVGALLGSLVGVLCIILLSQLGYVAALSGAVMAVGVLKGYELLGGKISKKSVVICVVIMLVMTYVGDRLDWAIMLQRAAGGSYGMNIFDWYRMVPTMITAETIEMSTYVMNLVLIYVFLLLGAVPTLRSKVKERQDYGSMVKIGSAGEFNTFHSQQ